MPLGEGEGGHHSLSTIQYEAPCHEPGPSPGLVIEIPAFRPGVSVAEGALSAAPVAAGVPTVGLFALCPANRALSAGSGVSLARRCDTKLYNSGNCCPPVCRVATPTSDSSTDLSRGWPVWPTSDRKVDCVKLYSLNARYSRMSSLIRTFSGHGGGGC